MQCLDLFSCCIIPLHGSKRWDTCSSILTQQEERWSHCFERARNAHAKATTLHERIQHLNQSNTMRKKITTNTHWASSSLRWTCEPQRTHTHTHKPCKGRKYKINMRPIMKPLTTHSNPPLSNNLHQCEFLGRKWLKNEDPGWRREREGKKKAPGVPHLAPHTKPTCEIFIEHTYYLGQRFPFRTIRTRQ